MTVHCGSGVGVESNRMSDSSSEFPVGSAWDVHLHLPLCLAPSPASPRLPDSPTGAPQSMSSLQNSHLRLFLGD